MGFIMIGMDVKPTVVGSHVAIVTGSTFGDRFITDRHAFTTTLIAAPGIATLASDCQSNVSKVDMVESLTAVSDPAFLAWS